MSHSSVFRIIFMGTPAFAVPALSALKEDGHEIVAVYTQPPRRAGRGQEVQKSPVHHIAESWGVPICTPTSLRPENEQNHFKSFQADLAIVAAYGLILPRGVLEAPHFGCINIHASLLPRWRGAAPIQRSILAGDKETGITIMQMAEGLDTGDMLWVDKIALGPDITAPVLQTQLADMGAEGIRKTLHDLADHRLHPVPQPEEGVTYASKLTREDSRIDWTKDAEVIERQVRALDPWPGSVFTIGAEPIKILEAEIISAESAEPGMRVDESFTVACGAKALRLRLVQRSGKKPTDGASLLRGLRLSLRTLLS